jgi:hypothetical protein
MEIDFFVIVPTKEAGEAVARQAVLLGCICLPRGHGEPGSAYRLERLE